MKYIITVLLLAVTAIAANPPAGAASDASAEVAAIFLDAAATKQAAGSDFGNDYAVIEVTITPKGGKSLDIQPDDFLMRIPSSGEHTGPLAAAQVLGTGGLVLTKEDQQSIGSERTNPGWAGATVAPTKGNNAAAIAALKSKMLTAKTTSSPVTGLLFFPVGKKKAKDLDLVYTTPTGKLHLSFK